LKEKKAKKDQAVILAYLHCELSPIGKDQINFGSVFSKISDLLDNQDAETVREAIERFSTKGTKGDGLGIVFRSIEKGWIVSKKRHEAEEFSIAKAHAERPTGQPITLGLEERFKKTDYGIIDEKRTQAEKQRQLRALRESEVKMRT